MTSNAVVSTAYHYEDISEWAQLGAREKAANVVQLCSRVPHATIVDIGAGEGAVLARLAELGFGEKYNAVEVTEGAAAVIRERQVPSLVDCRVYDGRRIPFEDREFDLAVLSHVVEHVEHPRVILREAARVARYVFVEVPLEHTLRLPREFVSNDLGHINVYSRKSIRWLLQSCGLSVEAECVTNCSRGTYTYHGDRLGLVKHAIKQLALNVSLPFATALWTYHGSLLARSEDCGDSR